MIISLRLNGLISTIRIAKTTVLFKSVLLVQGILYKVGVKNKKSNFLRKTLFIWYSDAVHLL